MGKADVNPAAGPPRVLLPASARTYRASDFLAAAGRMGLDLVVGSGGACRWAVRRGSGRGHPDAGAGGRGHAVANDGGNVRVVHGLSRALVATMVTGGYRRTLEIVGVGYRVQARTSGVWELEASAAAG